MSEVAVILVETGAELPEFFVTYTDSNGEYREMPMGMYFDENANNLSVKTIRVPLPPALMSIWSTHGYATHNGGSGDTGLTRCMIFLSAAA
jgi:hypothetical protein